MDIITLAKLKKCISVDINSGHSFATTTDRDTFFINNPTQLKANMYIYCNGQLQQYINSAWEDRSIAIQGSKGDKGDSGTNGTNGTNGITPHIDNTTKHWFIDATDTGILAEGNDGTNGNNGISPHIGLNGNWYIGEIDTLVKAQGTNGTNGNNGENGTNGVGIQSIVDNGDNTFTITLTDSTSTIIDKIDTINSDIITQGITNLFFTTTEKNKLTNIEENAEVNNISDTNATDLTDNGDTTLHYHSSDRDRTNHTGVQAISTVTGLQTALDNKTNKDFTLYTQKTTVDNDDKIAINDSIDSNAVKYVTLNQLVSSVQDPHNKGYYATGTALNTAIPTATNGDFAVVGETNTIWVWNGTAFVDSSASGAVLSINGETGIVTLTKNHIGLNNVVNFDTSTTANITDSTDKRFVTDANLVVIGNTSGTNTGDETQSTITTKIGFTPLSKTLADTYYEPKDSAIQTHIVSTSNPHSVTKNQVGLGNCNNTSDLNKPVSTATQTALDLKADKTTTYSKTEVDNAISAVITSLDWKESVATYTDIATTYPTPEDGWTVTVKDTDETYRYNGTEWVSILTSTIPLASDTVDGKMSSTDFTKLSNITGTNTGDETNSTIKTKLGTDLSNKLEATNIIAGTNVTLTKDGNNITINSTGGSSITIDSALSGTSENPVQNKVIKTALDNKVNSVVNMGLSSNDFTNTLKTKLDGIAESANNYALPTASTTVKGGIKVDGTSITVDENGVASAGGTGGGLTDADVFSICPITATTLPSRTTTVVPWYMIKAHVPSSVISIGDYWVYSWGSIYEINGGENLVSVGCGFIQACASLVNISLPNLRMVGDNFAYGCAQLTTLSLPSLTSCGSYIADASCSKLSTISLPLLGSCGDHFADGNNQITTLSLPSLASCGGHLACGSTSLTTLLLPSLKYAGLRLAGFCTALTHLVVGGANTLTLTSTSNNNWGEWKLPVADMVALGTALKPAATTTALVFGTTYWNALSAAQKAIFTNKNYTITTV